MYKSLAALQHIGLSAKEAKVYLALLSLGESSVSDITDKSGLKRPTVYVVLEDLRKKGFVLKVPKRKAFYLAKDPEDVFMEFKQKAQEALRAVPEMKALQTKDREIKVLYFDGEQEYEQALTYRMDELKDTEIVGFFAKADQLSQEDHERVESYIKGVLKNNIHIRGLVPEHGSLTEYRKKDAEENREMKIVSSEDYSSNISIDVTEKFVRICLLPSSQAIIIENDEVIQTIREIFEMAWKNMK